jgi:DNA-binding CsgD family transcriptional regulator
VELLLRAAHVACHSGAPADAVGLVQTALDVLPPSDGPERRAVLLQLLGDHRWTACDEVGSGIARSAAVDLLAARPPSPELAQVLAALGGHQMLTDRFIEAESTLDRALAIAEQVDAPLARCRALTALGFVLTKLGRWADGVDACRDALAIAERVGATGDIGRAHVMLTATLLSSGRYDEVVAHAETGLEHARRAGMLASDGVLLTYNRADALYRLGRWDEAVIMLAGTGGSPSGPHGTTGAVIAARIALGRGRRDEAERFAAHESTRTAESCACSAQVAALARRYDDARDLSEKAIELAEVSEDPSLVAAIAAIAIAIEADRVEAAALAGPRGQAETTAARATADDMILRARRHIALLESRGLCSPADANAHLATAEAEAHRAHGHLDPAEWEAVATRWHALGCVYPAAVAQYRQADALLRARGDRQRAQSLATKALRVAMDLDAKLLVEQLQLCAQRGRLDLDARLEPPASTSDPLTEMGVSKREREVLELVAAGRTNRQIAEMLYISDKTASVHVTHLLRKLGVASRMEAASIAQGLGLGR